jgi:deoxyribodipyrimidine photolyase
MTTVILLTRNLRVHDQPALHAATERGGCVLPLSDLAASRQLAL